MAGSSPPAGRTLAMNSRSHWNGAPGEVTRFPRTTSAFGFTRFSATLQVGSARSTAAL